MKKFLVLSALFVSFLAQTFASNAYRIEVEIDGFDNLLAAGYVDTFRSKYPEEVKYSWWNYKYNARARNVGWRIDYFLTSEQIHDKVEDSLIYNEYLGSDHCPVGLKINL